LKVTVSVLPGATEAKLAVSQFVPAAGAATGDLTLA